MHILLLCSNYAHYIVQKTPQNLRGTSIRPTGICLSPLFVLTAVTDGQNVIALMLVAVNLLLRVESVDYA